VHPGGPRAGAAGGDSRRRGTGVDRARQRRRRGSAQRRRSHLGVSRGRTGARRGRAATSRRLRAHAGCHPAARSLSRAPRGRGFAARVSSRCRPRRGSSEPLHADTSARGSVPLPPTRHRNVATMPGSRLQSRHCGAPDRMGSSNPRRSPRRGRRGSGCSRPSRRRRGPQGRASVSVPAGGWAPSRGLPPAMANARAAGLPRRRGVPHIRRATWRAARAARALPASAATASPESSRAACERAYQPRRRASPSSGG
jgi:hypothetical protein